MSGKSWTGPGGKPSSRPTSKSFNKLKRGEFMKAFAKKKSKYY